jgi:hypothetical protein
MGKAAFAAVCALASWGDVVRAVVNVLGPRLKIGKASDIARDYCMGDDNAKQKAREKSAQHGITQDHIMAKALQMCGPGQAILDRMDKHRASVIRQLGPDRREAGAGGDRDGGGAACQMRVNAIRNTMLAKLDPASVDLAELRRLAALDRYEARALTRRRRPSRNLQEQAEAQREGGIAQTASNEQRRLLSVKRKTQLAD